MKKLLTILMLTASVVCTSAQSKTATVTGAVVDPNGNPLPGAVVTATGGAETTIVESDGSFSLEVPIYLKSLTASYPGYNKNKKKTDFSKEILFTLHPKTSQTFVNLALGYSFGDVFNDDGVAGCSTPMFGVMIGKLNTWGYYGKILIPTSWKEISVGDKFKGTHITLGGIRKIVNNFFVYLGVGYGGCYWAEDYSRLHNGYYEDHYEGCVEAGAAFEGGLIFGIGRHFNITAGYTYTTDFYDANNTINISLGYKF